MTTNVIEIEGLEKEYRRVRRGTVRAVDGLDLQVPEGGVFGFLGPNGAGKTTTIRCLLGLVRPSSGRVWMLGQDVRHQLPAVIGRVGSIVETPALFPRFSGRRNLEILARVQGTAAARIDASLERVGLSDRAADPVRTYSLGMKQRLGIAAALLKDPALLILDEPANGLDPAGIVEVRELLRSLGADGRTVFVSSHILPEVQHVADRVAILAHGKVVASGPVRDVLASRVSEGLVVKVRDLAAGKAALERAGFTVTATSDSLTVSTEPEAAERVSMVLGREGLWVSELRAVEADLEKVFLELTTAIEEEGTS